ncbi:DUF4395 domain-containing protein [Sulfurimonas sp.]|uniref:DUF4395 domain-containing protein n=1 Tax=Sulfurimonas sp. TaxID=2022749 RepID=UPI002AAF0E51|nr:DUF4395 domain-containing protein [Sulfurimonas sp.]
MDISCPIAFREIDGTIVRIGAFFVSVVVIIYLFTSQIFLLIFLTVDFAIRIYGHKPYSPIYQLSHLVKRIFRFKANMTDAGAKRLAAQFGLLFSVMLVIEGLLDLTLLLHITAAALLACTFLEVLFGYCVGCKIYFIIKKIYPNFMS